MNELELLKKEVAELKAWKASLEASHKIPLNIDQSFRERFLKNVISSSNTLTVSGGGTGATTLTGILKGNGTSAVTAVSQLSGNNTFWVAASSGGATTKGVNITDGIVVSFS